MHPFEAVQCSWNKKSKKSIFVGKNSKKQHFFAYFHKSWKFQVFREIEIFVEKCCGGAQNDANTLKIILLHHYMSIGSIPVVVESKKQKNPQK